MQEESVKNETDLKNLIKALKEGSSFEPSP